MSAPKRRRVDDEDPVEPLHVPREVVARIAKSLSVSSDSAGQRRTGQFVLISWNIDGIDEHGGKDRMLRALAVAEHIAAVRPVAVMLQEAVPPLLELLSAPQILGKHYEFVCPQDPGMPYYCVMLLDKKRISMLHPARTTHFATSKMGRHLLAIDVVVDDNVTCPVTLMTTHLESTKSERAERTKQLTQVLQQVVECARQSPERTVILAGDLNARDEEVAAARKQVREMAPGVDAIVDAWEWCGSHEKHEFTWDTSTNNNLGITFCSRCRFDRCLFSAPLTARSVRCSARPDKISQPNQPAALAATGWDAKSFELIGRSRIDGLGRFPSDHWGLQISWATTAPNGVSIAAEATRSASFSRAPAEDTQTHAGKVPMSDKEREHRRELVAQKPFLRQEVAASRGVGSTKSLHKGPTDDTQRSHQPPKQHASAMGSQVDENDEAMLAQAIALSLEMLEPTATVKPDFVASGASTSHSTFSSLALRSASINQRTVIDLDD